MAVHEQGMRAAASAVELDAHNVDRLEQEYGSLLRGVRATFRSGKTKTLEWRIAQLKAIRKGFVENVDAINEALRIDLGRHAMEGVFAELASVIAEVDFACENLESWMKPESAWHPLNVQPGNSNIVYEPKGVVLILAPWNYPISLAYNCLVAAIVAGNCAIMKPSEVASASARLIEDIAVRYLDGDAIKVVQGAVPETTALLRLRWDHIIYTGNGAVGRIVHTAAAKHLTPVTLELGGKSPVYVDKSSKIGVAAKRIAGTKGLNNGQTCVAPDYVLVHESVADAFINEVKNVFEGFYGKDPLQSESYGRIINQRHWDRVTRLMDPTTHHGQVVLGGLETADREQRYIPPTVVVNPSLDSPLMTEEIFSMVLPVIVVRNEEEAIDIITSREHPLALYAFGEDQAVLDKIVDQTTSGGVCLNDCIFQLATPYLPFGGVGASGTGHYHGHYGFKELSHAKAVMYRSTWIDPGMRYAPYKDKTVEGILNFVKKEPMDPKIKRALMLAAGGALGAMILSRL